MNPRTTSHLFCFLTSFAFLPSTLFAEEALNQTTDSETIDLSTAVELALGRNFAIRVEEFGPKIAAETVRQSKGQFEPVFQSSYIVSDDDNPQSVDPFTELPDTFTVRDDFLSIGFEGLLPWGTTYQVALESDNRRGSFNDFEGAFSTFAGVTLTQPLLRNFGSKANRSRIRVAQRDYRISEWSFRQSLIDVITETVFSYNDLYFAHENLKVAERSRDLAARLLSDNLKRVESGILAPLDIAVAEARLALREERLIRARRVFLNQRNLFKQLITDEIRDLPSLEISIVPPPTPVPVDIDVDRDYAFALRNRPDYRRAILGLEKREIELVRDRNLALPALDFIGRYGLRGLDDTLGSSLGVLRSESNEAYTVGALFRVPITNLEGRSRRAAAFLAYNRSQLNLKRFEQNIFVEIDNIARRIETDWLRIQAAAKARELSARSLDAEERKLRVGTSSTFVVLELQRYLENAAIREFATITDYNKAVVEYYRLMGSTLDVFNVKTTGIGD